MRVQTPQYSESGGFSALIGHQLDSERTLVLVFASPECDQNLKPLEATQNGASCCELHNQTMTITTIGERN